ncbi:uncharacterized protein LOC129753627 [Uranotaenia lowii]|uniref:uncharacterized protein LOC129753627 n=1 Tax=Uranotaenia lowii TaxID=190385 RepID=UPI002479CA6A|nr:uncharacterized protein LOC129753627 [Uranotaenia lowii]
MLDSSIAKEMDLQGTVSPISYRWTNGITHTDDTSMIISLQISGPSDQAVWHKMNNVRTIKNMKLSQMNFDLAQIRQLYPLLDEEKLKVIENATPRMLIGSNNAGLIVPLKTIQYSIRGLQLTRCHLGWTVHGEIQPVAECIEIPHVLLCSIEDMELTDLIKTMYAVDNFGMTTQSPKMAEEDTRAVDIMNRTIKCIGDRYEVGQLYKFNHFTFPDSKPQALRRLKVMEKKMDADPEFADQYCNKIEDYLQKGYARKLTGPELLETPNTWYLPHFSVCSAKKFRLVMDAKAKSNGFSLNDLLLKGPDLVPPLIAVLMRGRRNKIAFMADIQEMFHQVRIRPEDQNSQRFFWRGMERKKAPDVYVMQAMIFGAVSSPCIAQYIKNFNANRLDEALPGVREAALCQHYVDDYFDCRDTEGEAIQLINNVIEAHRQGGFKLVKFVSNSVAVMKSIDSSLKAADEKECRVLGLKWDLRSDEFVFPLKFSNLPTSKVITKRQLLKFMMSIFDPLGVLGPITIHLKILFQDLWRLQIDWDDDIPDGLMTNWNGWLEQIGQIGEVRIPRYYFPRLSSVGAVELHAFCDASDKAFACVVYMVHRIRNVSHVALIIAKSKVAPLKAQTVPRLELQSCVTGSQMVKTIQDELKIEITSVHFWTDSRICLGWLNSTQKLTAYVGSRVTKIKENGHNSDLWKWIPSNLNVADFGTKNSMFCNMNIWLNGPEFLRFDQEHWPKQETLTLTNEEAINFNADIEVEDNLLICLQISTQKCFDLPDITRFSDFNRLTRSTAYYLKMLKILALPKSEKPERFSIDVNDINQARMMLYQKVQAEAFGEELVLLKKQDFVKRTSRLFAYSPFLHEGIIRMRGRVQDSSQPFEVNNPVILPDNHHFTNLLIKMYHIANGHQGTETIINNLNQRHRILKIRSQVKKFARTYKI